VSNAQSALLRLGIDTAAKEALEEEAEAIAEEMRAAVPVDSGELRDSISVDADGSEARITADAPYAAFVEHGTSDTPAQPFAGPAAEAARRRFPLRMAAKIFTRTGSFPSIRWR
jgi:HK97 gp10 family phage protein